MRSTLSAEKRKQPSAPLSIQPIGQDSSVVVVAGQGGVVVVVYQGAGVVVVYHGG